MQFSRLAIAVALVILCSGCVKRVDLSPSELLELRRLDPELEVLRVFPSKTLVSLYPELSEDRSVKIESAKVTVRGAKRPHERVIGKGTSGKVILTEEVNGRPLFWVTFFSDCAARECAYGFVLTDRGRYSLMAIPELEGYQEPLSYRGSRRDRNQLRPGKLRSVADLNEVFVVSRRKGKKLLTVDLVIKKDVFKPTRKTRQRAPGV